MAGNMNMVVLVGRLGLDPQIFTFDDDRRNAVLSLATTERWKDKQSGEPRERTEWHRVVLKRPSDVRFAEDYCCKGALVTVTGQIASRSYTARDGSKAWITEVVVPPGRGSFQLLRDGRQNPPSRSDAPSNAPSKVPMSDPNAPLDYKQASGG